MNTYLIYLKVPEYLREYLLTTFGNPIILPKDSPESRIIRTFITKGGSDPDLPRNTNVSVVIPCFKGADPATYNRLPESAKVALVKSFMELFKVDMYNHMTDLSDCNCSQKDIIYAYMNSKGISEEHWDTVAKIWYRLRDKYKKKYKIAV